MFILIEAHALIEAQRHFFLENIAIIWRSGPNLAIKQKNKMHEITLTITVPNCVIILSCYKELNSHELIINLLKIKAIKFQL